MAKMPDFSKLNFQEIMDNVKSIISPDSAVPDAPEGDEVAVKLVEMLAITKELAQASAQQADQISTLHKEINTLYRKLSAAAKAEEAPKKETKAKQKKADEEAEDKSEDKEDD